MDEGGADAVEVTCRIAVIQFPHIVNFDEFEVLAARRSPLAARRDGSEIVGLAADTRCLARGQRPRGR